MSTQEKKIILLVEAEVFLAIYEAQTMESFGYQVIVATSGERAVEIAVEDEKISLILLDIDLEGPIDGSETARQILRKRNIPIIFLTSHSEKEYVDKVKGITRYGYVIKDSGDFVLRSSIEMAFELFEANKNLQFKMAALRESEKKYRELYDFLPIPVYEMDLEAKITSANQAMCDTFGGTEEDFKKGFSAWQLLSPEGIEKSKQNLQKLLMGEKIKDTEYTLMRLDGTIFPALIISKVIYHHGLPEGVRGAIVDLTVRKRAEEAKEELEAQNRQLEKAESLGRMAGAIAHHFNNQLGVVVGNLEVALMDLPPQGGSVEMLNEAMTAARRASEVSGWLLTYLGQTSGQREPLDLSEVCRLSLPLLQAVLPKDVVLESELPSPGPAVNANPDQIQQVLTILTTNAWEAMEDGRGAIHLSVKTVSPADIPKLHCFPIDWQAQDNAYACLELADSGAGIDEKTIEKLFDPFFSTKFTSRGMGLAVVLGVVRAHRGVVTVESEPGLGSIFRVFLPLSAEEVLRRPEKVAQTPEIQGGGLSVGQDHAGTVLLVEDEAQLRKIGTIMLTRLGYTVLVAEDGVEALEVFRQHQDEIRCVLSDLSMPRLDGWGTLAALRKLAPDIPVVLASGYDEAWVMSGDHAHRPQAFLSKPYDSEELGEAIAKALEKKV